uniref:L-amino-acid oxidase n=1 Tax=Varanus komodoensis TaxID=61221 RepID=A0A8D2JE40_VARKO
MQRAVAVLGGGVSGLAACFYLARSSQVPKVRAGLSVGRLQRQTKTESLLSRAQTAVREHLGIVAQPSHTIVKVQKACIPQYTLGHWKHVENAEAFLEREQLPLSLVGASYRGVSVNDCISSSQVAVTKLLGRVS